VTVTRRQASPSRQLQSRKPWNGFVPVEPATTPGAVVVVTTTSRCRPERARHRRCDVPGQAHSLCKEARCHGDYVRRTSTRRRDKSGATSRCRHRQVVGDGPRDRARQTTRGVDVGAKARSTARPGSSQTWAPRCSSSARPSESCSTLRRHPRSATARSRHSTRDEADERTSCHLHRRNAWWPALTRLAENPAAVVPPKPVGPRPTSLRPERILLWSAERGIVLLRSF